MLRIFYCDFPGSDSYVEIFTAQKKLFNSTGKEGNKGRPPLSKVISKNPSVKAVVAEVVFGVADITGAYIAGVVLSTNHRCAQYVDKKVAINSYMLFGPIFFAHIGMQISFEGFNAEILLFALAFVAAAIIGKILGCGLTSKIFKFSMHDSLIVGFGMIARGEVALVVAQKGITAGLMDGTHLAVVVMLVLVSSVICPLCLKALSGKDKKPPLSQVIAQKEESSVAIVVSSSSSRTIAAKALTVANALSEKPTARAVTAITIKSFLSFIFFLLFKMIYLTKKLLKISKEQIYSIPITHFFTTKGSRKFSP